MTDAQRLTRAFARLVPPGLDRRVWREQMLRQTCLSLLTTMSADEVGDVYGAVRSAIESDAFFPVAAVRDHWRRLRDLREDAPVLRRRLSKALTEACRFHERASREKWYSMRVEDGVLVGPAQRSWRRYHRYYEATMRMVDADPAIRFVMTPGFAKSPRGNPIRHRNSVLRSELRALGVKTRIANTILSAIGFTGGR
jgi:hypothetical protein